MQIAPTETIVINNHQTRGITILPTRVGKAIALNNDNARRLHKELGAIIRKWDDDAIDPDNAAHAHAITEGIFGRPTQQSPDALVLTIIDTHRHIENLLAIEGPQIGFAASLQSANQRLDALTSILGGITLAAAKGPFHD